MSFIYAEQFDRSLNIYCDTKIELDEYSALSFSVEQKELIQSYGIVKTTIICPEISISFAGNNIFLASKLFTQLYKKKSFKTKDVIDMAMDVHLSAGQDDIEFIIASCENGELSLHCIKEGKLEKDCQLCWIGSAQAYRDFQRFRIVNRSRKVCEITGMAFLKAVNECSDETVGKFVVSAGYDQNSGCIKYSDCITMQMPKSQNVRLGESIKWYLDASEGGFTVEQVPMSYEELRLDIYQMGPSILYTRNKRCTTEDAENPKLFSLMLPMLISNKNGVWIRC